MRRLEKAKQIGRNFYNSLPDELKQPPIDVIAIIKQNPNWSIFFADLCGEDGYTLYKILPGNIYKFKICINKTFPLPRIRFTIAHEIGHIILGHFKYYSNNTNNVSEVTERILDREADMFAGELLMPYEYMLQYYDWSIQGIANKFFVSKEAATVRKEILAKDPQYRKDLFFKQNPDFVELLELIQWF